MYNKIEELLYRKVYCESKEHSKGIKNMKKILLVTFSDNSDHQDSVFGMFEELKKKKRI